jgi:enoyl-CoA hydratase/carnithine racemase
MLPKIMGLGRANDILLTSRVFYSEEAHELGFVNQLVGADELMPRTYEYVKSLISSVAPNSIRQTRWQIYRDLHRDVAASVTDSEVLLDAMMGEPDYKEGVSAFVEKRPPNWGADNS